MTLIFLLIKAESVTQTDISYFRSGHSDLHHAFPFKGILAYISTFGIFGVGVVQVKILPESYL